MTRDVWHSDIRSWHRAGLVNAQDEVTRSAPPQRGAKWPGVIVLATTISAATTPLDYCPVSSERAATGGSVSTIEVARNKSPLSEQARAFADDIPAGYWLSLRQQLRNSKVIEDDGEIDDPESFI